MFYLCAFVFGFLFLQKLKHLIEFIAQSEKSNFVCQSYKTHSLILFSNHLCSLYSILNWWGGVEEVTKFIFYLRHFLLKGEGKTRNDKKWMWVFSLNFFLKYSMVETANSCFYILYNPQQVGKIPYRFHDIARQCSKAYFLLFFKCRLSVLFQRERFLCSE